MGWSDIFSCFRRRTSESEVLVAPSRLRAQSIISQDGYGTMGMSVNGAGRNSRGSSTERDHDGGRSPSPPRDAAASRQRMAEISRTAGNHMKPITSSIAAAAAAVAYSPLPHSSVSSRNPSPSPQRPLSSPPGGVLKPRTVSDASAASAQSGLSRTSEEDGAADGVVRKSIFTGDRVPSNGSKSSRSSKKGRRTSGRRSSGRATAPPPPQLPQP